MGSDRLRLACFTAASFGVLGVHVPFWPGWLEHRGLSAVEIGELGMVYMCTRGVASPMWAHFVDRSGRRKLWLIAFTLGAVVGFAPVAWADDYPALLALTILFGIAHAPVLPLGENLLVLQARERGIDYGRTRLWGSVAFMGASLGAGMLLDDGSWSRTWWLVLLALALSAAAALALPADPTGPRKRAVGVPLAELLGNRRALAVLAGGGIVQSAHAMYYMFSTLHWEESGHSTRLIGALWAEAVVAETLFFAFARQLGGRGSERYLMLFAVLAGAIRWSVLASTTSVVPVAGAQLLHALTFAAAHLAVVRHLQHAVPERLSASAQSLYGALNIGAHALVLSFITPLYASSGATAYWPMIAVGAVGGALALWGMSSRTVEWRG
jgi:PPP family 3-phenylpropionic acid transporter